MCVLCVYVCRAHRASLTLRVHTDWAAGVEAERGTAQSTTAGRGARDDREQEEEDEERRKSEIKQGDGVCDSYV